MILLRSHSFTFALVPMNSDDGAAAKAKASATATEEAGESADNDPRATFGGVEEERVMNDSTLPRLPMAASSAARVADSNTATTLQKAQPAQVVPRSRKKVGRFGMADWSRLLASTNDLAQRKGRPLRKIRWDEIRQHASVHDGWIVLKQKVYNISPYMVYHPGGESILKAVLGKDATALFDRYHRWVNEDGYGKSLSLT
jgi:cytochrome b involved in lipid metabolism